MNRSGCEPSSFFDRNTEERPEIVEGLIREGDIAVLAGNYGKGKSPMIADLTVHLVRGLEWCGRKLVKRPVVAFDFESAESDYKTTIKRIAGRLGVPAPQVPQELKVFLQSARNEAETDCLWIAMSESDESKLGLIESALKDRPNAVVFIDPIAMYFPINWSSANEVVHTYRQLRSILHKYPRAVFVVTCNLRKRDRRGGRADLLTDARGWLEEVSGSLDILNRSDVRLGIETYAHDEDVRVVNGIVRGREMNPLLIRPVCNRDDHLAGFEQVTSDNLGLLTALTPRQKEHWDKLPAHFRFDQVADDLVPRASLFRLIDKAESLDAIERREDGGYHKKTSAE